MRTAIGGLCFVLFVGAVIEAINFNFITALVLLGIVGVLARWEAKRASRAPVINEVDIHT